MEIGVSKEALIGLITIIFLILGYVLLKDNVMKILG